MIQTKHESHLPDVNCISSGLCNAFPGIKLLAGGCIFIVLQKRIRQAIEEMGPAHIAHKGIECTKHSPSSTQGLSCIASWESDNEKISVNHEYDAYQIRRYHFRPLEFGRLLQS